MTTPTPYTRSQMIRDAIDRVPSDPASPADACAKVDPAVTQEAERRIRALARLPHDVRERVYDEARAEELRLIREHPDRSLVPVSLPAGLVVRLDAYLEASDLDFSREEFVARLIEGHVALHRGWDATQAAALEFAAAGEH